MDFFAHHILSVVLFTPLVGALLLLFVPREQEVIHRVVGQSLRRSGLCGFAAAAPLVQSGMGRLYVRRKRRMDSVDRREIPPGHRRHQPSAGHAHDVSRDDRHSVVLERHQAAPKGILHSAFAAAGRHARRFRLAGFLPLLRFLGSDARADVFPDRRVGQRPAAVRGDQVLPVHAGRIRRDAAGDPGAVFLCAGAAGRVAHV